MAQNFTEFQQQAINTDDSDICVAAGAGSGKTGVLVERFVRLITHQHKNGRLTGVDNLLVITFTEKATKEMKARIAAALTQFNLIEERRQLETAYISTIHGFCSRLLQENPFEAGVDPQFSVLDEPQAKRLLRAAFDETIANAYIHRQEEITELVAAMQEAREFGQSDTLTVLANAVEMVIHKLRGAGISLAEAQAHFGAGKDITAAKSLETVWVFLTPLLKEIRVCGSALVSLKGALLGSHRAAYGTLEENAAKLKPESVPIQETLVSLEAIHRAVNRMRASANSTTSQEWDAFTYFQRIKIACEEARLLFGAVASREAEAHQNCHRLWACAVETWKNYQTAKKRQGKLDNDDLQAEGVTLLEKSAAVRKRYQQRFHHLMVDEFQDTNPLQMRLILCLHVPQQLSADVPANHLFVVGDVQQSIYGFRNADPTLFRGLEREFRENHAGTHVALADNFRSRDEILAVVRHVFQQVWRNEATPFMPLRRGANFTEKPMPSIELLLSEGARRGDYQKLEADALAARIQQIVEAKELRITSESDKRCGEPVAYRDFAILLRALTDISRYEEAFARRGVPYYVVGGGRGYYARHEIRDLLNVLTVMETPLDDMALAATLRSPFVGIDADTLYHLARLAKRSGKSGREPLYPALRDLITSGLLEADEAAKIERFLAIIEDLRAQEDRIPVGHLLERLITRTQYDARLLTRSGGRRRLANVRKLLQMANADSVIGVRGFIHRLRDLEKLSEREGDAPTEEEAADVVRFLTIHTAKGLEFPVVVLADLSRGLIFDEKGTFVCDPQRLAIGTKLGGEPNLVYKAIVKQRQEADKKEYERLLYVAMTRAREHLILCGDTGRNNRYNWASELFPLLGILDVPPNPEIRLLSGGIEARVAPLIHDAHAPIVAQRTSANFADHSL